MDRFDRWHVRAEAWLNHKILGMNDAANRQDLLNTFSGAGKSIDKEFRDYIITLFSH
jgi:hypothetical protein